MQHDLNFYGKLLKESAIKHDSKNFDKIQKIFPQINKDDLKSINDFLSKITSKSIFNIFEYSQIVEFLMRKSINNNKAVSTKNNSSQDDSSEEDDEDDSNIFLDFMNYLDQSYKKYDLPKNTYSKLTLIDNMFLYYNSDSEYILTTYYNNITDQLNDIASFKFLRSLRAAYHKINSLPASIKDLENLEELHLNDNDLEEIPDSIKYLKKLRKLDLSSNKLTSLPECIGDLENLEELYIVISR